MVPEKISLVRERFQTVLEIFLEKKDSDLKKYLEHKKFESFGSCNNIELTRHTEDLTPAYSVCIGVVAAVARPTIPAVLRLKKDRRLSIDSSFSPMDFDKSTEEEVRIPLAAPWNPSEGKARSAKTSTANIEC